MRKQQPRAKKSDNVGKGYVTPVQVAFIVDRYLSDNNFSRTRSAFRSEASSLIAKSPVNEAPRGLLSLGAMLNEYISLKEQKVAVDQEKTRLEQETWRIQTLLQGMQDAMNAFNAGSAVPSTPAIHPPAPTVNPPSSVEPSARSPSGCLAGTTSPVVPFPGHSSQTVVLCKKTSSSQMTVQPSSIKRKFTNAASTGPLAMKKSRSILSSSSLKRSTIQSSNVGGQLNNVGNIQSTANSTCLRPSPQNNMPNGSTTVQSSSSNIAKRLFYPPSSTPAMSPNPTTPPQGTSSRSEKSSSSPMDTSPGAECCTSNTNTPEDITPSHCTVVSYEKITVSPFKQIIERGQCISSSPAKRVKGRLDFNDAATELPSSIENEVTDNTSTSESEKEVDPFDWDFNLEVFGPNFSFSDLLIDLDLDGLDGEGFNFSCGPTTEGSDGSIAGLPHESSNVNLEADQLTSEISATVTEIHSENDVQIQGVNNVMAVKSVTRRTSILSPVKNPSSSTSQ